MAQAGFAPEHSAGNAGASTINSGQAMPMPSRDTVGLLLHCAGVRFIMAPTSYDVCQLLPDQKAGAVWVMVAGMFNERELSF
jgi:hypothetical protein